MYVYRNIVVRLRKHCYHGNKTKLPLFIAVGLHGAVNNIKNFCVAMEMRKEVPFALSCGHNVIHTAVNNIVIMQI
jgi:hypothetical protein